MKSEAIVHPRWAENISRAEWLKLRREGLGGSDIASILYGRAMDVWWEKTQAPDVDADDDSNTPIAMRRGSFLEPFAAEEYERQMDIKLVSPPMLQGRQRPWMLANPDRMSRDGERGVEIKAPTKYTQAQWEDEPPSRYVAQCYWYMLLTGAKRWDLAGLLDDGLVVYPLDRDEDALRELEEFAEHWWNDYVVANVPPPAKTAEEAATAMRAKFPAPAQHVREATDAEEQILANYALALETLNETKANVDGLKAALIEAIGPDEGIAGQAGKATYKKTASGGVDYRGLAKHLGATEELIERFKRPGSRRWHWRGER